LTPRETVERRIGNARYVLREVGPADTAGVLALFSRAFGTVPPAGWHAWKYGSEGLQGRAMGLWADDGRLVAHYAGFPRRMLWHGNPVEAIQIGDVMVAPEVRGLLSRRGPFFQVCSAFFDQWVGPGRSFALAFGFPSDRAIRLGMALGEAAGDLGEAGILARQAGRQLQQPPQVAPQRRAGGRRGSDRRGRGGRGRGRVDAGSAR